MIKARFSKGGILYNIVDEIIKLLDYIFRAYNLIVDTSTRLYNLNFYIKDETFDEFLAIFTIIITLL